MNSPLNRSFCLTRPKLHLFGGTSLVSYRQTGRLRSIRFEKFRSFTDSQGVCFCGFAYRKCLILFGLRGASQFHSPKTSMSGGGGGVPVRARDVAARYRWQIWIGFGIWMGGAHESIVRVGGIMNCKLKRVFIKESAGKLKASEKAPKQREPFQFYVHENEEQPRLSYPFGSS